MGARQEIGYGGEKFLFHLLIQGWYHFLVLML